MEYWLARKLAEGEEKWQPVTGDNRIEENEKRKKSRRRKRGEKSGCALVDF